MLCYIDDPVVMECWSRELQLQCLTAAGVECNGAKGRELCTLERRADSMSVRERLKTLFA